MQTVWLLMKGNRGEKEEFIVVDKERSKEVNEWLLESFRLNEMMS
jgi:hypothetical protein